MKKPVKKTPTKQASSAANVAALKKEFKAKLAELSKQFDKQLLEVKKAAQAKAVKEVNDTFAKQSKAKDKAVKDAISQVDKARDTKAKSSVKATVKLVKKVVPKKASIKKPMASKKKAK
jgi:uncharacterized coiled-coil protein SlyX